ncbi:hypothetical protein PM082_019709 [Marasmius tenuissimus]|nr:hypothetical protein PM082_019709 [Marasmius tenuissimus]
MPRTPRNFPNANAFFCVRGYRIPVAQSPGTVRVSVVSSSGSKSRTAARTPLIEHRFTDTAVQPYIHDIDIVYRGVRFRIYFQRHRGLPVNQHLGINGDLLILRIAKGNTGAVVNLQGDDARKARNIGRIITPLLARFQQRRTKIPKLIHID